MRNVLRLLASALVAAGRGRPRRTLTTRSARPTTSTKKIKLEGKLVQFAYRNPHSFVHIEAPDENGVAQRWAIEWGGTAQLANAGREARLAQSRRRGRRIIASPSRVPGEFRVLMVNLTRPSDGFAWGRRPGEQVE